MFKGCFFLAWIQQVLLFIEVTQSLPFHYYLQKKQTKILTTYNFKILAQPEHFRKPCEAWASVWSPAEMVPSAELKLANGTRYRSPTTPIFITYTTTSKALDMTDFF